MNDFLSTVQQSSVVAIHSTSLMAVVTFCFVIRAASTILELKVDLVMTELPGYNVVISSLNDGRSTVLKG